MDRDDAVRADSALSKQQSRQSSATPARARNTESARSPGGKAATVWASAGFVETRQRMQQQHKEASSQLVATELKLLLLRACAHCNLSVQTCVQMLAIAALESSLDYLDHIGYPRTAPDYLRNEELLRDVRNKVN